MAQNITKPPVYCKFSYIHIFFRKGGAVMDAKKVGNFIALKRKECGLTQLQLAEKLFITDKAVSKWERGLACPDISSLQPLAKLLGVSIVELLNGESCAKIDENAIIQDTITTYVETTKKICWKQFFIIITLLTLVFALFISAYSMKQETLRQERIQDAYDSLEWAIINNLDKNLENKDYIEDLNQYQNTLDSINYAKETISQMRYVLTTEHMLRNNDKLNSCLYTLNDEIKNIKNSFYRNINIQYDKIVLTEHGKKEMNESLLKLKDELNLLSLNLNQTQ